MSLGRAALLSAATGFLALSWEILWIRVYAFATGGRSNAFGNLLGAYLVGIALGSFFARRFCDDRREAGADPDRPRRALALLLSIANLAAFLAAPLAAELVRRAHPVATLPLFATAAALLGTALPLLSHAAIPADGLAGARLAKLYVANIAGCGAGGLVTGFLLLEEFRFGTVSAGLSLGSALLAVALSLRRGLLPLLALLSLLVPAGFLLLGGFDPFWEKLQLQREYRPGVRFANVIENRCGVITVDASGAVFGGGMYDGRFNVDAAGDENGIVRAYAVAALHPEPRSALVIGLGSGAWAQAIANHPSLERVTVVDINPGYLELLRLYPEVRSLLANPKVSIVVDDGRRWLHAHDERFDLVVQNTTYHWRSSCTNLVSREYFALVRDHLNPGGVFYSNTTGAPEILRTALDVFANVRRFRSFVAASDGPMAVDAEQARLLLRAWSVDGVPRVPETRIEEILGGGDWEERASIAARTAAARVITDDNMAAEWKR